MTVLKHNSFAALVEEFGEEGNILLYATAIELDRFETEIDCSLHVALKALQIVAHSVLAVAVVACGG